MGVYRGPSCTQPSSSRESGMRERAGTLPPLTAAPTAPSANSYWETSSHEREVAATLAAAEAALAACREEVAVIKGGAVDVDPTARRARAVDARKNLEAATAAAAIVAAKMAAASRLYWGEESL